MRFLTVCASVVGVAFMVFASAGSANAQATRTWVSGVGDDANPCSRTAPCKTYAGAISKTATNGEINCLDPGGFGTLTITKSISVVCDYTEGGVLSAGVNGFIINAPAGSIVTLKGQDIECVGTGINGIEMINVGVILHIHKVQIRNCRGGGNGVLIANSSATALVSLVDSYITDNGNSTITGGLLVRPTGSGSVFVDVNRTQFEANALGIRIDSSATTGVVRGLVRDSVLFANTNNGVTAVSGANLSQLMLDKVSVVGNTFGIVVNGATATINTTNSTVTANGTGLFVNGSGTLNTYHTNSVNNNTSDGAFTNFISPQ